MTQADHIIAKFGGLSATARALGHRNVSTVQGWHERGLIHPRWYDDLLQTACQNGVALTPADFVQHLDRTGTTGAPSEEIEGAPV